MKKNIFGLLLWRFRILKVIKENAYLKEKSTINKELLKLGFSATQMFVCIFVKCYENLKS